jgi:hypothetical protein
MTRTIAGTYLTLIRAEYRAQIEQEVFEVSAKTGGIVPSHNPLLGRGMAIRAGLDALAWEYGIPDIRPIFP